MGLKAAEAGFVSPSALEALKLLDTAQPPKTAEVPPTVLVFSTPNPLCHQLTSSTIFWVPFLFDIPSGSVTQPYAAESLTTQVGLCSLPAACFSSNWPKYHLNPSENQHFPCSYVCTYTLLQANNINYGCPPSQQHSDLPCECHSAVSSPISFSQAYAQRSAHSLGAGGEEKLWVLAQSSHSSGCISYRIRVQLQYTRLR